jgi:hypothetical protein
VYDEEKGIVVDTICPAQDTVTEKQKAKRGKKVLKLLKKIDAEAKKKATQMTHPTPHVTVFSSARKIL